MRRIVFVVLIPTVLMSCHNRDKDRITVLENRLGEVTQQLDRRNSEVNGYLDFLIEIEKNMNEIRKREALISLRREEFNFSDTEVRDQMISDLQTINRLMQENKERIAVLTRNLNGSKTEMKQLRALVEQLSQTVALKDRELRALNGQLAFLMDENQILKNRVDSLSVESEIREDIIREQEETMRSLKDQVNTAYFAAGTYRDLEEQEIIIKEGGFLGIGAVKQLNDNLNLDKLTTLDIRTTFSIPVHSKKVELITDHPLHSYKLVRDDERNEIDKLLILDPDKFWASTNCAVLVTR